MQLPTVLLLLAAMCAVAADKWVEVASPNFHVYTTAGAENAGRICEHFEQVRDFFMRIKSSSFTTKLPVSVIVFKSRK
jgi:hypothetical protein